MSPEVEARFWAKVQKTDSCWLWTGCKSRGYGRFRSRGNKVTSQRTHRVSWEIAHGPIPDGLKVLHRCDTPACVRPDHLFLGTQKENVWDSIQKGRHVNPPEAVEMSRRGTAGACGLH
jgi:hypothetical protein